MNYLNALEIYGLLRKDFIKRSQIFIHFQQTMIQVQKFLKIFLRLCKISFTGQVMAIQQQSL